MALQKKNDTKFFVCVECGAVLVFGTDGVCPVCAKDLCHACWRTRHKNQHTDAEFEAARR